MDRMHRKGARVLALVAAGAFLLGASPRAAAQDGGTRIGVVDMKIIFDQYSKSIEYDKELKKLRRQVDDDQRTREEEMERLAGELKEYREGSPEHTDALIQLRSRKVDLDYWLQEQGKMLRDKLIGFTDEIEGDIRRVSREVAEVKGLDLIINYSSDATESDTPPEEKRIPIILFARDGLDVTQDVLEALNRPEPEEGKEKAAPPPPPEKKG